MPAAGGPGGSQPDLTSGLVVPVPCVPAREVVPRPYRRACTVGDADATEHAADVGLHSGLTDAKVAGDLLVGQPPRHQPEHLQFAGAEFVYGARFGGGQESLGDTRVERCVTLGGG